MFKIYVYFSKKCKSAFNPQSIFYYYFNILFNILKNNVWAFLVNDIKLAKKNFYSDIESIKIMKDSYVSLFKKGWKWAILVSFFTSLQIFVFILAILCLPINYVIIIIYIFMAHLRMLIADEKKERLELEILFAKKK